MVNLGLLGLDRGGHLLLERALAGLRPGQQLRVEGTDPAIRLHLQVWARHHGHRTEGDMTVVRGDLPERRWADAQRAGRPDEPAGHAPPSWGLAARGALVETGGPPLLGVDLDQRHVVWTELAPKLYAQAAANQWDPATAVDWAQPDLPVEIENSRRANHDLPNRKRASRPHGPSPLSRSHPPHYREVIAFLTTQVADEARHVDVFTRRAALCGRSPGISGAGGRASLQTLLEEPDWANASFLLSVLGEGSFLSLLSFLRQYAPDPVTAGITHLVLGDEARHVAFALGHLGEHVTTDDGQRDRLRAALERRHDTLATTAGLSPAVNDSLVLIAAGSWTPAAIQAGWDAVQALQADMDEGRRRRLIRLGFSEAQATELSALHTKNFM